jgi:hypothetical protein
LLNWFSVAVDLVTDAICVYAVSFLADRFQLGIAWSWLAGALMAFSTAKL